MPNLQTYSLNFRSGLHLGTQGVNLEESTATIPSDTLFAALVDTYRRVGGEPDDFVKPFPGAEDQNTPPFLLTSAFPFAGKVRFYPMPVPLQRIFSPEVIKERRKAIKGIHFVSEMLFREILDGKNLDHRLFPERGQPTDGLSLQGETFWLTTAEVKDLPKELQVHRGNYQALKKKQVYRQTQVPRVQIDRINAGSQIYHTGKVTFAAGCGLWFGIDWKSPGAQITHDKSFQEVVEQLLGVLQDDGLGGERTAGYGVFDLTKGNVLQLQDAKAGKPLLLLSRYNPQPGELPQVLEAPTTAYQLVQIGGWLRSWGVAAQRRRQLWILETGSVIQAPPNPNPGKLVDVRPEYQNENFPHPIWRYGLALGAGMQEVNGE